MLKQTDQKLCVCDICGEFPCVFDRDRRLVDHFRGKLHLGCMQIREKIANIQEVKNMRKKCLEEEGRSKDQKWSECETSTDYYWHHDPDHVFDRELEKERDRERVRSHGYGSRSRHRSRSRERTRYRRHDSDLGSDREKERKHDGETDRYRGYDTRSRSRSRSKDRTHDYDRHSSYRSKDRKGSECDINKDRVKLINRYHGSDRERERKSDREIVRSRDYDTRSLRRSRSRERTLGYDSHRSKDRKGGRREINEDRVRYFNLDHEYDRERVRERDRESYQSSGYETRSRRRSRSRERTRDYDSHRSKDRKGGRRETNEDRVRPFNLDHEYDRERVKERDRESYQSSDYETRSRRRSRSRERTRDYDSHRSKDRKGGRRKTNKDRVRHLNRDDGSDSERVRERDRESYQSWSYERRSRRRSRSRERTRDFDRNSPPKNLVPVSDEKSCCIFRLIVMNRQAERIKISCKVTAGAHIRIFCVPTRSIPDCALHLVLYYKMILITGKQEPESKTSPAMAAAIRAFKIANECAVDENSFSLIRFLVDCSHVSFIESMQLRTITILDNDELPFLIKTNERIVQLSGKFAQVLEEVQLVLEHQRKFLVPETALPLTQYTVAQEHHLLLESPIVTMMTIPLFYATIIFGRGNTEIDQIQSDSNATIIVSSCSEEKVNVEIRGTSMQVEKAQEIFHLKVAPIHRRLCSRLGKDPLVLKCGEPK